MRKSRRRRMYLHGNSHLEIANLGVKSWHSLPSESHRGSFRCSHKLWPTPRLPRQRLTPTRVPPSARHRPPLDARLPLRVALLPRTAGRHPPPERQRPTPRRLRPELGCPQTRHEASATRSRLPGRTYSVVPVPAMPCWPSPLRLIRQQSRSRFLISG